MGQPYIGTELELFAGARRWKRYLAALLRPYLVGDVLEVGAGIGGTTGVLCDGIQRQWVCLEPDPEMAARLARDIAAGRLPGCCRAVAGSLRDLPDAARFDVVAYIDVLEHIAADAEELSLAARRLNPGGALIVVAPAHPWLYSPFDATVRHLRRYTRRSLARVAPAQLERVTLQYLDSVGVLASAANRLFLRSPMPTGRAIAAWDGWMVPLSRRLDPLLGFRVGKSLLGVWRLPDDREPGRRAPSTARVPPRQLP